MGSLREEVQVGKTEVRYQLRALDDLHKMPKQRGDCMPLGSADEQEPAAEGTVEAWAWSRSSTFRKTTGCELAEPAPTLPSPRGGGKNVARVK